MKKKKYLLNPNAPDAFSPEVMHKAVLNGIDFELPDHIWDAINAAFEYYWDVEVGLGGWVGFNPAVSSISNQLLEKNIIYPFDKIVTIVEIMFNWIEQIPGALLDDEEVEDPLDNSSGDEIKKEERLLFEKLMQEEEECDF